MLSKIITELGSLILVSHKGHLVYCNWDEEECLPKLDKVMSFVHKDETLQESDKKEEKEIIKKATRQIMEYFRGRRMEFHLPLQFKGTPFQEKVWSCLAMIPYGTTVTYKELAALCNCQKAIRAVAGACGANPLALFIPCHRVTGSKGHPGGYTGGLYKKINLLKLEKAILTP